MRTQQRLAATGGDAQADARHIAKGPVVVAVAGALLEGGAWAKQRSGLQKFIPRLKGLGLVALEVEAGHGGGLSGSARHEVRDAAPQGHRGTACGSCLKLRPAAASRAGPSRQASP